MAAHLEVISLSSNKLLKGKDFCVWIKQMSVRGNS